MSHYKLLTLAAAGLTCVLAGCVTSDPGDDMPTTEADPTLVWATNVGGVAYVARDGTHYRAEEGVAGGQVGWQDQVKGSQNETLYRSYREGDLTVSVALDSGLYDVTLKFSEPHDTAVGDRVFHVLANGERIVDGLDVRRARDGQVRSALTVTVPDVRVEGGALNLTFESVAGEPVLNGVVVRRRFQRPENLDLVWRDEFDRDGGVDPDRWNIDLWPPRKVNDEDQTYTDRPKNLRVEDGVLIIEAHREALDGAQYTSARIHSAGKGDVHYGRVEVRARLPSGQGTWPAIWMLPSDPFRYATTCGPGTDWQGSSDCDAWPNSGEIDIMEHVGYEMGHVHGTVHTRAYYWAVWEQRKGRILLPRVDQDFHVYALEWSPEIIRMYVDDHHYFSYVNEGAGWESWPFDQPFHVILNVAVGGMWGRAGGPIDDSIFPQRMEVDYVRVYRMP